MTEVKEIESQWVRMATHPRDHIQCFNCGEDGLRNEHYYLFDGKLLCSKKCVKKYKEGLI